MDGNPSEKKPRRPKFPRRRWSPGQVERVEEPKRGGAYDRDQRKEEGREEIDDALNGRQNNKDKQGHPDANDQ